MINLNILTDKEVMCITMSIFAWYLNNYLVIELDLSAYSLLKHELHSLYQGWSLGINIDIHRYLELYTRYIEIFKLWSLFVIAVKYTQKQKNFGYFWKSSMLDWSCALLWAKIVSEHNSKCEFDIKILEFSLNIEVRRRQFRTSRSNIVISSSLRQDIELQTYKNTISSYQ